MISMRHLVVPFVAAAIGVPLLVHVLVGADSTSPDRARVPGRFAPPPSEPTTSDGLARPSTEPGREESRSAAGCVLSGRAVFAGDPLSAEDVVGELWRNGSEGESLFASEGLVTDAAGDFEWPLAAPLDPQPEWSFRLRMARPPHGLDEAVSAGVPVPRADETGRVALGRVPFPAPFPSVAGIVVGPDGGPIAGARLLIQVVGITEPLPGNDRPWTRRFESEADGSFRSYAPLPQARLYQLSATEPGTTNAAVTTFEPGQRDVLVEFRAPVEVRGNLALGLEPPGHTLEVRLVEEDPGELTRSWLTEAGADGAFTFPAVPEGRYHLTVRDAEGLRRELWSGPPLVIARTVTGAPLELASVDLSGLVARVGVLCEDPDGRPLAGVEVRESAPFGISTRGGVTDAAGRLRILVPADESPSCTCSLPGVAPISVTLDADPTVIVLAPGLEVPIEAPLAFDVPQPFRLAVVLRSLDNQNDSPLSAPIDENGIGLIEIPREGRYHAWLQLRFEEGPKEFQVDLPLEPDGGSLVDIARTPDGTAPALLLAGSNTELQHALDEMNRLRDL